MRIVRIERPDELISIRDCAQASDGKISPSGAGGWIVWTSLNWWEPWPRVNSSAVPNAIISSTSEGLQWPASQGGLPSTRGGSDYRHVGEALNAVHIDGSAKKYRNGTIKNNNVVNEFDGSGALVSRGP